MNRNLYETRFSPALAVPSSSILLHADESGKFPASKKGPVSNTSSRSSDSTGSLPRFYWRGVRGFFTEFFEKASQVEFKRWRKFPSFYTSL
jgi:hypothetical protein